MFSNATATEVAAKEKVVIVDSQHFDVDCHCMINPVAILDDFGECVEITCDSANYNLFYMPKNEINSNQNESYRRARDGLSY